MLEKQNITALILAAGRGTRLPNETHIPKQYLKINDKTILYHSINVFEQHPQINTIQVMIHPDDTKYYQDSVSTFQKCLPPLHGGETRQKSTKLGLESLKEHEPSHILIHDAARPYINHDLITNIILALETHSAVIPAIKATDTIKQVKNGIIHKTPPREQLYHAQTPQGFSFPLILEAHIKNQQENYCDDASLIEQNGDTVHIINGDNKNIKITTENDMPTENTHDIQFRTGFGFDVHRFIKVPEKNYVTLAGIQIPHEYSLEGHSDADVALHALTDALLGCIAAGDIGIHFPPSDSKHKNQDSEKFINFAVEQLHKKKATILHVDLTFICETPKITPHHNKMKKNIAHMLQILPEDVSIKATTTEKMGFTGRKEGIAVQAVANIRLIK